MAFRAASSASGNTDNLAPSSTGVVSGDVVFLAWHQGGTPSASITWPSGFAEIADLGASGCTIKVAKKTAGGSEPANYTITTSQSDLCVAAMVAFSGRDTAASITPVETLNEASQSLPGSIPLAGVTAANGDDICWIGVNIPTAGGTVGTWAPPASYTERVDVQAPSYFTASVATRDNVSAGATGTLTGTLEFGDDMGYGGFVFAVPAAGGGGSTPRNLMLLGVG